QGQKGRVRQVSPARNSGLLLLGPVEVLHVDPRRQPRLAARKTRSRGAAGPRPAPGTRPVPSTSLPKRITFTSFSAPAGGNGGAGGRPGTTGVAREATLASAPSGSVGYRSARSR